MEAVLLFTGRANVPNQVGNNKHVLWIKTKKHIREYVKQPSLGKEIFSEAAPEIRRNLLEIFQQILKSKI